MNSNEQKRLQENSKKKVPLAKWGTYLADRQWGTVREDYSPGGDAWDFFTHDQARSKAYRWGEDGIGGISDYDQHICFGLALWNGKDPILKERLFGLTNSEGNHGEDVKELYYYLENLPTHYYAKMLYKYPINAFPYKALVKENAKRSRTDSEYEILDTGIFDDNNYFDVSVTYAKNDPEDICIEIEVINRSEKAADLTVLPTLWFRNVWEVTNDVERPKLTLDAQNHVVVEHPCEDIHHFYFQNTDEVLFTENETNHEKISGGKNKSIFVKDAFHEALCDKNDDLRKKLNNRKKGTKCSPVYEISVEAGASRKLHLRLSKNAHASPFNDAFFEVFTDRKQETDAFYDELADAIATDDERIVQRQALAGLLWNRQFYYYNVKDWLYEKAAAEERIEGRNSRWKNMFACDVLSMPDCWEYPWFASWDLAFHCVSMSMVDPAFAKNQLILIMREWYMSPDGQIPAYEWNFSDVNPPVQAWAALQVYYNEQKIHGITDTGFLKRIFQKLLINFTWWANRQDNSGNNIFSGGFLGMDNIAIIDRNNLPKGYSLEQVDATSWMAMYALNMLELAAEITKYDPTFEDSITKFYEHYILIAKSMNQLLWDEEENFFYDLLATPDGEEISLKVRSLVGITALFAVTSISKDVLKIASDFQQRVTFLTKIESQDNLLTINDKGEWLLSLLTKDKLRHIVDYLINEEEFLAEGGIRSLSKVYEKNPLSLNLGDEEYNIAYVPGASVSGMFGGNSNWRGPVWFPINYLIIRSLEKYGDFYGNDFTVEFPLKSGKKINLNELARELSRRLCHIFAKNEDGQRAVHGEYREFYAKPENSELVLFYEYFNGDTICGVGASHQTGWTSTVANLINKI